MKIFYNGKRLKDIYPHATRWQMFKFKVRKFFIRTGQIAGFIFALYVAAQIGSNVFPSTVYATRDVPVNVFPQKMDELKNDVVTRLMACESGGYSEEDGIIIFDSNKQASIGQAQFQKKTVIHFYQKLYNKDISAKEAVVIALDEDKARQLAKDVIFKVDGGVDNWYNCAKKLGLHGEIAVIKKLEK